MYTAIIQNLRKWVRVDINRQVPSIIAYRKIPKISPAAYIFQRSFLGGLSTEGDLRFKIDWATLVDGSKFPVFALFHSVFEGNFPSTSPPGGLFGGAI